MIFSSATEYAIRGLSELVARSAGSAAGGRVLLDDLVAGTDLPRDFLAKIFQRLVRAGVLVSAKGRGGGFSLARPAHAINLLEIVIALDGQQGIERCVVGLNPDQSCGDAVLCPLHDLYKPIRTRLKDFLATTTLADLGASLRSKPLWPAHCAAVQKAQQEQQQQHGDELETTANSEGTDPPAPAEAPVNTVKTV
jgi:Rrf2 family protein